MAAEVDTSSLSLVCVGAPVAAIVGEDELQSGEVTLKHLESGDQERLPIDRAAEFVRGGR